MNQALNNLLSREDDDGDDTQHEEGSGVVGLSIPSGGGCGLAGGNGQVVGGVSTEVCPFWFADCI